MGQVPHDESRQTFKGNIRVTSNCIRHLAENVPAKNAKIRSSNANPLSGGPHCCLSYAPECLARFRHCPNLVD